MAGRKRSYGRGNQDCFQGDSFKRMRGPHSPQFMGGGGGFMQPPQFSEDGPFPSGPQGQFPAESYSEPFFPEPGPYSEPPFQEPGQFSEPPYPEPNYNEGFGMDNCPPPFFGGRGQFNEGFGRGGGMERGRGRGFRRPFRGGPMGPGGCPPYMWMPQPMGPQWGPGRGNRRNAPRGKFSRGGEQHVSKEVRVENMTPDERVTRLWNEVRRHKRTKAMMNTIEMLTNVIRMLKPKDDLDYQVDTIHGEGHEPYITGALRFENVFLARSTGCGKKDLKARVFEKAQNNLMYKTVEEIKAMVDPGVESIRADYQASKQAMQDGKYSSEDVEKDLMVFVDILLNQRKREILVNHPVLALEQASPKGHETMIRHVYRCDMNKIAGKRTVHTGHLDFGNIVLGRGQSLSRKQCKYLTFKDAMERITTKPIAELLKSLPEEEPSVYSMVYEDVSAASNAPLADRLTDFINAVKELKQPNGVNITPLVNAAASHGLTVTTLVRAIPESDYIIRCEVYVGDVFITAENTTLKRDSIFGAYKSTWEILRDTSAKTLLENQRLTEKDITAPTVFNVRVQGAGRIVETNASTIVQYGHNPNEILKKKIEDMVIIEGRDGPKDRINSAFYTLKYSCCQNAMLLQWELQTVKDNVVRCEMIIQGKKMGMSYGPDIIAARNLAAADFLFKAYDTHDVLKTCDNEENNDEQRWISWDTVKAEGEKLREAGGGGYQPDAEKNGNLHGSRLGQYGVGNPEDFTEVDEDGDTGNKIDKKRRKTVDPYIMEYIVSILEKFADRNARDEELVFGPGIDYIVCCALKAHARTLKLKYDSRMHDKKCYTILYNNIGWHDLAGICKRTRKSFGKFMIYKRDELPKYADVASSILKSPELVVQVPEEEKADEN